MYNAEDKSTATLEDCKAMIGESVTLPLTGTIVDAGESLSGAFVKFEIDKRWGFPEGFKMVMDLEAFEEWLEFSDE